jgi:hypothetical protein
MPLVSKTFDQLLDFTRTTSGTFVGSNGLIQNTPASVNLLTFTQQFDNAAWTKTAATVTANTTVAPDGTSTADKLVETTATSAHTCRNTATVTASTTYTLTVYAKAGERTWIAVDPVSPGVSNNITFFNLSNGTIGTSAAGNTAAITDAGNGWYRCTVTRTTAVGQITCFAQFAPASADNTVSYTGDGTSGIFIWGAQLEVGSTATTYTRNNGGVYPPRFDYDPVTLAAKGLLIEEQRTNLLVRSEEFDAANWSKSGSTVTANATNSPDGTVDADKLVEAATTAQHRTSQAVTVTSGAAYTYSIYAKAAERTSIWVRIIGAATFAGCIVDLTNGAITGITGTSTATNVGNGWYRITVSGTSDSTTATVYANLIDGAGANTYLGDGTSGLFIWGAQLEAGAFATSYIPTVASQVTRTADQCSIVAPNFAPWYNQSEGTFVINFTPDEGLTNNVTRVLAVSQGGVTARVVDLYTNGTNWVNYNGTTATAFGTATVTTTPQNIAIAYKTADYAYVQNAGTVAAVASALVNAPTQMAIGHTGSAQQLNGHIRSIRYYPVRLSNAQIQALTA